MIECADAREWLLRCDGAQLILSDPPHLDTFRGATQHPIFIRNWLRLALTAASVVAHTCGASPAELRNYLVYAPDQVIVWPYKDGEHWRHHHILLYGAHLPGTVLMLQKPMPLYDYLVAALSKKGDMVADPFCGRGEIPAAAKRLGRRWMGCDINAEAVAYCGALGL